MSISKVYWACRFLLDGGFSQDSLPRTLEEAKHIYKPKCDIILEFLEYYYEVLSIPLSEYDEEESAEKSTSNHQEKSMKLALGCFEGKELYDEFMLRNNETDLSYTYFKIIWTNKFPYLTTVHDRACPVCDSLVSKIRHAEKEGTSPAPFVIQYQDHVSRAKSFYDHVDQLIRLSKRKNSLVLFSDHWGKKYLPASKRYKILISFLLFNLAVRFYNYCEVCMPINVNDFLLFISNKQYFYYLLLLQLIVSYCYRSLPEFKAIVNSLVSVSFSGKAF